MFTVVLAVAASIAARFATLSLFYDKGPVMHLVTANSACRPQRSDRVFLAMTSGFLIIFCSLAILRLLTFHTGYTERDLPFSTSWDLGQYHQIIWNSLHGRLFENTYILDAHSFLGKTFSPILLAFVPLYAIWSNPIVLLLVQTLAVGLSSIPLYWFARKKLGHLLALVVALTFFLSPAVENSVLTEFHEITLIVPILSFSTFFLLRRNYGAFLPCLALGLLVKEEVGLVMVALGIFILIFQRNWKLGLAVSSFGLIWVALLVQFIIPFFRGAEFGQAFYYFGKGAIGGGGARYGYLGTSLAEILATVITKPDIVIQHVLIPAKLEYLFHLFVPLAFVPFLGIEVALLALPTIAYSLLSDYALQYSIRSYYFSPLLPFLFFALIIGVERLLKWSDSSPLFSWCNRNPTINSTSSKVAVSVLLLVTSGTSYFFQAPGPFGQYFESERYVLDSHAILANRLMNSIPSGVTVVAQNEFLARLSDRVRIYEIPIPDYRQVDYLFADRTRFWYGVHQAYWEDSLATGFFELLSDEDGFLLARRREPAFPLQIQFADQMTLLAYTMVPYDNYKGGESLRPFVGWHSDKDIRERFVVQVHLVDQYGHVLKRDDREPLNGAMPTEEWIKGQYIQDQYWLPIDHTVPTGEYHITLQVYNQATRQYLEAHDQSGRSLGHELTLATFHIDKSKAKLTVGQQTIENRASVNMNELKLIGFTDLPMPIHKGQVLPLGLYWQAVSKPTRDYVVAVQLLDTTGRVLLEQAAQPAVGTYPTTDWEPGEMLLDWHDLSLPGDLPVGPYQMKIAIRESTSSQNLVQTTLTTVWVQD